MSSTIALKPGATLTEYCTAGKFVSEKQPMLHQRRTIDSFVILYGVSGTVHINNSVNNYSLSPNDYIILPAMREHYGTEESPPGVSYYWCHFYIRGNYSIDEDAVHNQILTFGENSAISIPLFGKVTAHEKMHLLFHQLIDSSRSPSPLSKTICGNFLEIIIEELAFSGTMCDDNASLSQEATVANIIEWIRLNASEIKRVSDVADYFGYNSEYLTTLVKKITAKSLVDHITESRINLAKKLLRSTNLEISEIAYKCGFSDDKYFFRVFKKMCDISPGAYRKTYSNLHINGNLNINE
ncbi:MAG: helix-turn-helix domain-containing protein [Ruminococcaceae bacterium]|nr:helix-turn-helix domain-containing protein [Oscillospiraceae bacterium]